MSNDLSRDNPYAAPVTVSEDGPLLEGDPAEIRRGDRAFQSAAGIVKALTIMLLGMAALDATFIVIDVADLTLFRDALRGDGEPTGLAIVVWGIEGLIGLLYMIWYIVTVVVFCRWIYRANSNAHALGAEGMEYTPGWSVGWFFVPIANLFKPYSAVKETYLASEPKGELLWKTRTAPSVIGLWWGIWILGNVISNIETRLSIRVDNPFANEVAAWLGLVSGPLGIAAALLCIKVVQLIQQRQEQKAARVLGLA